MKLPTKVLLIFSLIISPLFVWGQNDSIQVKKKTNSFIGVDLFAPVYSLFTDKKGGEILFSYPLKDKIHLVAEVGYEQNKFDENGWNADVSGPYGRIGAQYFLSQDEKNPNMGYYVGGRFGYSNYQQTINSFLIQDGDRINNANGTLPKYNANVAWFEPLAGGRVQIKESRFYIDASIRLKLRLYQSNPYDITTLAVPGFGKDTSGVGFGVNWTIGYLLPF